MRRLILLLLGFTFLVNINGQVVDSLIQRDYLEYAKRAKENGFVVQSKDEWYKSVSKEYNLQQMFPTSPGTHLIKAKSQILGGLTLQLLSSAGIIINTATNYDGGSYKTINSALGGLSLIGVILQISGVVNIGKAGVSLNTNGIGLKVNF